MQLLYAYTSKTEAYAALLLAAKAETGCNVFILNKDSDISYTFKYNNIVNDYKVDFLLPLASPASSVSFENRDDYSPIITIEYKGKKIMLATDATANTEATYNNEFGATKDVDVLVASKHGDSNSTSLEFLNNVKPEYVIIISPVLADDVISRVIDFGATLYRTDINGNIAFTINSAGELSASCDN